MEQTPFEIIKGILQIALLSRYTLKTNILALIMEEQVLF